MVWGISHILRATRTGYEQGRKGLAVKAHRVYYTREETNFTFWGGLSCV